MVAILGVFLLGGLLSFFIFRTHPIGRAIVRVAFLILLTIALLHADIIPYRPLVLTGSPFRDAVPVILKIAWWLLAGWFLVGVMRALVIFQHSPREGKLLQDLLAGLVYLTAVFAIITYVFDLPIQGFLATSGVVAIILGLALQSTLGDVFSGIVLSFSRPYRPGDWVNLEGGTDGRVIEMNWRATYVLTARRDLNRAEQHHCKGEDRQRQFSQWHSWNDGNHSARRQDATFEGSEILEHAILNCRLIVATPAPSITVKTINASYTEFELRFLSKNWPRRSRLRTNCSI